MGTQSRILNLILQKIFIKVNNFISDKEILPTPLNCCPNSLIRKHENCLKMASDPAVFNTKLNFFAIKNDIISMLQIANNRQSNALARLRPMSLAPFCVRPDSCS
jgi:hypothetical protein